MPIWCERMKEIRTYRNFSQEDIAIILGTSQSYYAQYEKGMREIPFHRMVKLTNFYGIPIGYFIGEINLSSILEE